MCGCSKPLRNPPEANHGIRVEYSYFVEGEDRLPKFPTAGGPDLELAALTNGDLTYFRNFEDYLDITKKRGWRPGENAIKLGSDRYWAHPLGVVSRRQIEERLKSEYRKVGGKLKDELLPEWNPSDVGFIDVVQVGIDMFEFSKKGKK
jgi:hypothetical protein